MRHLIKTALVAGVAALAFSAPAMAAPTRRPRSTCPPWLAAPVVLRRRLYSPTGGDLDRPMLVIYASFTDTPFPAAMPVATAAARFFGGFPSVRDYFLNESFGRAVLTPAAESEGTANDGIVQVNIASNKAVSARCRSATRTSSSSRLPIRP